MLSWEHCQDLGKDPWVVPCPSCQSRRLLNGDILSELGEMWDTPEQEKVVLSVFEFNGLMLLFHS